MPAPDLRAKILAARTLLDEILADWPATPLALRDRTIRPKPPLPTWGPTGDVLRDPVFGSRILRVTDQATTGGRTSWRTSSASDQVWSADGTKFFVENSGGGTRLFAFDAVNLLATDMGVDIPLVEPTWVHGSSTQLFGRGLGERPVVARFDLTPKQMEISLDILARIPEIAARGRTYLRGVCHASGALSCICGGTGQDSDDFTVYVPVGGPVKILNTLRDPRLGIYCHAASLDRSGRYVVLGTTQGGINAGKARNYVWDTLLDVITPMTVYAGGHGALGYGVAITAANEHDSQEYRWRTLAAPDTTRLVITDLPKPPQSSASSHLSWNHVRPGNAEPFVVASYRYGPGYAITPATPWREWDDEIISVAVDGQTIRRHCHHRSDVRRDNAPPEEASVGYWATPRPRTSPDGKWALFTSNWEKTLGADPAGAGDRSAWRQDVFCVELLP